MNRNLFVSSDAEGSNSVPSLGCHGRLTRELLEHFGGTSESITRFANRDIWSIAAQPLCESLEIPGITDNELLNPELLHRIDCLRAVRHRCSPFACLNLQLVFGRSRKGKRSSSFRHGRKCKDTETSLRRTGHYS